MHGQYRMYPFSSHFIVEAAVQTCKNTTVHKNIKKQSLKFPHLAAIADHPRSQNALHDRNFI